MYALIGVWCVCGVCVWCVSVHVCQCMCLCAWHMCLCTLFACRFYKTVGSSRAEIVQSRAENEIEWQFTLYSTTLYSMFSMFSSEAAVEKEKEIDHETALAMKQHQHPHPQHPHPNPKTTLVPMGRDAQKRWSIRAVRTVLRRDDFGSVSITQHTTL